MASSYVRHDYDEGRENGRREARDDEVEEDGNESPDHRGEDPNSPGRETGQKMAEYEDLEAEILKWCRENNCPWEDKDFPAGRTSLVLVSPSRWLQSLMIFVLIIGC